MTYINASMIAKSKRNFHRRIRHGVDWRGILDQYGGLCANTGNPIYVDTCEIDVDLELHEPFGEDKLRTPQHIMQQRVLLCRACHSTEHRGFFSRDRGFPSLYLEDMDMEIAVCGSITLWRQKYNVGNYNGNSLFPYC